MQSLANILQLGVKEMRSLWFDKVLLIFLIWSFSFGLYEAARSQSAELRNASSKAETSAMHATSAKTCRMRWASSSTTKPSAAR